MIKTKTINGVFIILVIFVIGALPNSVAFAESDLLFSAQSNKIWALKKSTRKLIYMQFEKQNITWKSNTIIAPSEFNLNESVLTSVGSRGTSVFLYDKSSGLITFFTVQKDHSIRSYIVVNMDEELK